MIFTSESVTPGHPDKLCDQISDACLDAFLEQDPDTRISVECAVASGVVFIAANFLAKASVDLPTVCRGVLADAGYAKARFDSRDFAVLTSLADLSPTEAGAMQPMAGYAREHVNAFGFACRETESLMPMPIVVAHCIARRLAQVQKAQSELLACDGKAQVAIEYDQGRPRRIHAVTLMSALQPPDGLAHSLLEELLREEVLARVADTLPLPVDSTTRIQINPAGLYLRGGPAHHAGLTGRKIAIDTYGDYARQSGSALSGKDPSRIDRMGSYAARYAAKNIVAAGLAERCEVHVAYAPGEAGPVSVSLETFGTGRLAAEDLEKRLLNAFDLSAPEISRRFRHRLPASSGEPALRFRDLAVYGQIGRTDMNCPWEACDLAPALV